MEEFALSASLLYKKPKLSTIKEACSCYGYYSGLEYTFFLLTICLPRLLPPHAEWSEIRNLLKDSISEWGIRKDR